MHRHRMVVAALALMLSGCAASSAPDPSDPEDAAAPGPQEGDELAPFAPAEEPSDAYPCLGPQHSGALMVTAGPTRPIDAAVLPAEGAEGGVGIVLAHQADGDLCQWIDEARDLAEQGYEVIIPEVHVMPLEVIAAAAATLREEGAEQIVLMGASMGGTYALAAAAGPEAADVAAVVSLSGPAGHNGVDAVATLAQVSAPILAVAGERDGAFGRALTQFTDAAPPDLQTMLVDTGAHGVELLEMPDVEAAVADFLTEHAPPR